MAKKLFILMSFWLLKLSSQNPHWAQLTPTTPVSADMTSMFVDSASNTLYLGGRFEYLGGKKCRGAAKWNGSSWDSLGIGFDRSEAANFAGDVKKIVKFKNKIYYFGTFEQAGLYNTKGMAIWNGSSWDSIGSYPNGYVYDADVYNDTLYIAGNFTKVGAMTCSSVAKFDGTTWYNNLSFPYGARGIRAFKNKIYIIGTFYTNGYSLTAEWDYVSGWKPSFGVQGNTMKTLNGLERIDSLLFFYGRFTHLSTVYSPCLAAYSGTHLYSFGNGAGENNYPTIHNMKKIVSKTYLLGIFESMGGMSIPGTNLGVATLDGSQYCIFGNNFDNLVKDMVGYNNELIICGSFWKVTNDSVKKIAKWIGGAYTYSCSSYTMAVGIDENTMMLANELLLYPNPVTTKLKLAFSNHGKRTIQIINSLGQLVLERVSHEVDAEVDVLTFKDGIYFLKVYEGNTVQSIKFLKN